MKNSKCFFALLILGCAMANSNGVLRGQEVERDTTITGPRGRTIQRQVEIQRKPGMIDRSVQIKRPGGTFDRQVQVQRSPLPGRGFIPGPWPRPAFFGPRPLVIAQPAPAFGFRTDGRSVHELLVRGRRWRDGHGRWRDGHGRWHARWPGAPPPPPPDQVALMCQRLQGFHLTGRKEAAYTLGQLGDPRAVPTLVHVLKYDNFKDVRVASAIALGEIGGSQAAVALERAAVYDHREDVKKAASTALERLNAKAKADGIDAEADRAGVAAQRSATGRRNRRLPQPPRLRLSAKRPRPADQRLPRVTHRPPRANSPRRRPQRRSPPAIIRVEIAERGPERLGLQGWSTGFRRSFPPEGGTPTRRIEGRLAYGSVGRAGRLPVGPVLLIAAIP